MAARRRRPQPHRARGDRRGSGQGVRRDPRRDPHAPPQRQRLRRRRRARLGSRSTPASTTRCSSPNGPPSTTSRTKGKPTKLYVRARRGETEATSKAIPTAINLGGPDSVSTKIPSDALAASAQADETLQQTALFAGILALAVGGIGIANVMSISVIQRSSEIGIRRAARAHAFDDRAAVPARGAVRRHPRGSAGVFSALRSCISCHRSRAGSSSSTGPHAAVDRARRRGVGAGRALPVGQGRPARATGDAAPRLARPGLARAPSH